MGARAPIDLPIRPSIRLFHTYTYPIILYAVENWAILSDMAIQRIENLWPFDTTEKTKTDVTHR